MGRNPTDTLAGQLKCPRGGSGGLRHARGRLSSSTVCLFGRGSHFGERFRFSGGGYGTISRVADLLCWEEGPSAKNRADRGP
jgi:hypothetical protein